MRLIMSWPSVLKSLLAVCIFTHLSVSCVESYRCENTKCFNGRCFSDPRTCESSKGCFYLLQEFEAPTEPVTDLRFHKRGCSKDDCTELAFSATLGGNQTFVYDLRCCYSEQCNSVPKRVSRSTLLNGVECPACFSDNGTCNPVSLKCTGEETKCVEVTGTEVIDGLSPRVIRGMGCATKTACSLKNMVIGESTKVDTVCSKGSPPLRFISSSLVSLFLVKALL